MALTKVIGEGLGAITQDGAATFNESSADVDFRVESNGDANAVFVDAGNDKVGLFTSTPSTKLDVVGSQSDSALTLRSGDVNNSANGGKQIILGFNGSTSYSHAIRTRHNSSSNTNNAMYFDVWQSSQSASDIGNRNVAIFDGDAISFPNQPSIAFQGNNGTNESHGHGDRFGASDDGVSAFTTSTKGHSRTGITYTTTNGRFTITTAGIYLVYFQAYYNGSSAVNIRIDMSVNGVQQVLAHHTSMDGGTTHLSYSLLLSANDYIHFQHKTGSAQNFFCGNAHMLGYIIKVA
tara:strand:- start:370 stop:1245 length:876 start_codon:yes stop_codon:yes gene_type:complete